MKYKCIKETEWFKVWAVYEENEEWFIESDGCYWKNNFRKYFQEVQEEPVKKPKWKVGDKVVLDIENVITRYWLIQAVVWNENNRYYKTFWDENWEWDRLRCPTPEELSLYFN